MDANCISFWAMIGTWFAGLATFFATMVALYNASIWKKQIIESEKTQIITTLSKYLMNLEDIKDKEENDSTWTQLKENYDLLIPQFLSLKTALLLRKKASNVVNKYNEYTQCFKFNHESYMDESTSVENQIKVTTELMGNILKLGN
ncbi:hypothetical protein [Xenorhabdus sp. SGI246]|uniref:hypothetical protein n=1 Tax=Xenorhabdus sp. SGI246 TaxID=3158263 RepID=UPI00349F7D31